jgi:hypothetical protein
MGESEQGTQTGRWRGQARRVLGSVIAALAVADLAYRLLAREPLRRALGIEARHA